MFSAFYAKIMLFGEYGVIWDSMALTVPYTHFTGELGFINDERYTDHEKAAESNRHILRYIEFLKTLQSEEGFEFRLDLGRLAHDAGEGLYFESNIPQGYGIGSSGALVAAIYENYGAGAAHKRKHFTGEQIALLKRNFSRMESYFHGISSGLDPLICYLRSPLLIRNKERIEPVSMPGERLGKNNAIFLVDTGMLGKTGPLVNLFLENCKKEEYLHQVKEVFIPSNDGCIIALLDGQMEAFYRNLEVLSGFQYEYLSDMIPQNMKHFWKSGLERDDFKMKLCGSGGGGFLLGISRDFKQTRNFFREFKVDLIPVYKND